MVKEWRSSTFGMRLEMSTLNGENMWPVRPLLLFALASLLLLAADFLDNPVLKATAIAVLFWLLYCEIGRRLRGRVSKRVVFGKTFAEKQPGLGHSLLFIGLVTIAMIVGHEFRETFGIFLFVAVWLAVAAVVFVGLYRLTRLAFAVAVAFARLLHSCSTARL